MLITAEKYAKKKQISKSVYASIIFVGKYRIPVV
jgi:hypothetical protein